MFPLLGKKRDTHILCWRKITNDSNIFQFLVVKHDQGGPLDFEHQHTYERLTHYFPNG